MNMHNLSIYGGFSFVSLPEKKPVCIFQKLPKTLYLNVENHEDGPKPYFFIRKCATGRPDPFFLRKTNEKPLYI